MITKPEFVSQGALARQDELVTLGLMSFRCFFKKEISTEFNLEDGRSPEMQRF
jgi:hypothetical protein